MAKYFEDAPLIRSRFVAQDLVVQAGDRGRDLTGIFLRILQVCPQFVIGHFVPISRRLFASIAQLRRASRVLCSWHRAVAKRPRVRRERGKSPGACSRKLSANPEVL